MFLDSAPGQRFCLYHPPRGACRGALVYLHPFAEEMNKSRRMAALQARALSALGVGVLQIDLHGCGDSDGEFGEARWDGWLRDTGAACAWLEAELGRPVGVWGLRLGALLALAYAHRAARAPERLLLWQPVLNGATYLTQFLRLRVAGSMLDPEAPAAGTRQLREQLTAGHALEVAGYMLAPELAATIDTLDAVTLAPPCPTDWLEVVADIERAIAPAALRVAAAWGGQTIGKVAGPAFWSTQEMTECPQLLAASCTLLAGGAHD